MFRLALTPSFHTWYFTAEDEANLAAYAAPHINLFGL
jgi:hypothetical protein